VDSNDGAKMLEHTFSGKNGAVQQKLAGQTGLQSDQVSGLMAQLAPLLLGALGQQKKQQNLDATGVAGLLNGMLSKGGGNNMMDMTAKLLDSDQDGDIMDDISKLPGGLYEEKIVMFLY
jgi:hypothetical protein